MSRARVGVVGLGVMGENLALNLESRGFEVIGLERDDEKVQNFLRHAPSHNIRAETDAASFVQLLDVPRKILIMVPAGKAVDAVIAGLRPNLLPGDLLIDGGNTHFADTERRLEELSNSGVLYIGAGVSGGEEGALKGPAIMPSGNAMAWPLAMPVLQAIAAKAPDGTACCEWIGNGGSGHFVKMVHNGIEYADMQTICEGYYLMSRLLGMEAQEIGAVFDQWNQGELSSYLIEITAEILQRNDDETGRPLVDVILDTAAQKGTGKWTGQIALELGAIAPTISEAVFARNLSAIKMERAQASKILRGPTANGSHVRAALLESIRRAVFFAKICAYAQGFHLLAVAAERHGWEIHLERVASIWRAGCIIRAQFLERIKDAYTRTPSLVSLLFDPYFTEKVNEYQSAMREVVAAAALQGIACPSMMSALAYYDGYRSERLPANLLQAQRDYFGSHTYQRIDRPGTFHTKWGR